MWWLPLVQAGIGMIQSQMQNNAMKAQREQQSKINAYSPLFGGKPEALPAYNPGGNTLGAVLGGALSGYSQMQNAEMQEAMKNYMMFGPNAGSGGTLGRPAGNPAIANHYDLGLQFGNITGQPE